jgi:RNA polymerase sigma factor (sigma-70 family)
MIEDFINFSQEKCKSLILEYQITKEQRVFHLLLAKYDRYILKVLYDFQRKCPSLRSESLQELYHTGVIGFARGIKAFKPTTESRYICNHVKAYIKSEVRKQYIETKSDRKILETLRFQAEQEQKEGNFTLPFLMLIESKCLNTKDKKVLKLRYIDELTTTEIGKRLKCHRTTVSVYLKQAVNKLKKAAKDNSY